MIDRTIGRMSRRSVVRCYDWSCDRSLHPTIDLRSAVMCHNWSYIRSQDATSTRTIGHMQDATIARTIGRRMQRLIVRSVAGHHDWSYDRSPWLIVRSVVGHNNWPYIGRWSLPLFARFPVCILQSFVIAWPRVEIDRRMRPLLEILANFADRSHLGPSATNHTIPKSYDPVWLWLNNVRSTITCSIAGIHIQARPVTVNKRRRRTCDYAFKRRIDTTIYSWTQVQELSHSPYVRRQYHYGAASTGLSRPVRRLHFHRRQRQPARGTVSRHQASGRLRLDCGWPAHVRVQIRRAAKNRGFVSYDDGDVFTYSLVRLIGGGHVCPVDPEDGNRLPDMAVGSDGIRTVYGRKLTPQLSAWRLALVTDRVYFITATLDGIDTPQRFVRREESTRVVTRWASWTRMCMRACVRASERACTRVCVCVRVNNNNVRVCVFVRTCVYMCAYVCACACVLVCWCAYVRVCSG